MTAKLVLDISPLETRWQTLDPFLFCVHHNDAFPAGNAAMEPSTGTAGRHIGQDFSGKDGWSMYHGDRVPGFPQHPHRGFETVTVVRHGFIDHSDSLGARARFGQGDVQWMTAGRGVVHSEMFPLLEMEQPNHTELFQIWLNLPAQDKMADPYFSMFWQGDIPSQTVADADGRETLLTSYARPLPGGGGPPTPPPSSWAANTDNHVAIWTIKMAPEARWTLPAADPGANRRLYYFSGNTADVAGVTVRTGNAITLVAGADIAIANGGSESEFLLLEGRPIGEPVAQHGPFVMTSREELHQAFEDYRRTQFGGWQWPDQGPVHPRNQPRFAEYPDGTVLSPNPETA